MLGGSRIFLTTLQRIWRHRWEAIVVIMSILISQVVSQIVDLPGIVAGLAWLVVVVLLAWDVGQDLRSTYNLLREKHLPMVVMIGTSDDLMRSMTDDVVGAMRKWGFDEPTYRDDFHVQREDWVLRRPRLLPPRPRPWVDLVDRFEGKINALAARLEGQEIFHLFLNCPAVLAIGLGAALRTNYLVVLHHYTGSGYESVIDFYASRQEVPDGLSQLVMPAERPFQYIEVQKPEELNSHLYVALHLAGHDPQGAVENLASEAGASVVHVRNTYENRLTKEHDWLLAAREVVTVLLGLVAQPDVERVHLFVSSPVVLATAIGMGLGTHSPISVYHWFADQRQYHAVFELEKL